MKRRQHLYGIRFHPFKKSDISKVEFTSTSTHLVPIQINVCGRARTLSLMDEERRGQVQGKKKAWWGSACIVPIRMTSFNRVVSAQSVENPHWYATGVDPAFENIIATTIFTYDRAILLIYPPTQKYNWSHKFIV